MTSYWTEKAARAKCRRKLKALRRAVRRLAGEVAYEWGDVDHSIVCFCDDLIASTETACADIADAMDFRVEGESDD